MLESIFEDISIYERRIVFNAKQLENNKTLND